MEIQPAATPELALTAEPKQLPGRKRPRPESGDDKIAENDSLHDSHSHYGPQAPPFFEIEWLASDSDCEEQEQGTDEEEEPVHYLDAIVTFPMKYASDAPNTNMLCLMGRAQIQCVKGSLSLLGYRLDPSHPKVPVESPPWSSLLVMEPVFDTDNGDKKEEQGEERNINNVSSKDVIIKVESWWPQQQQTQATTRSDADSRRATHQEPTFEIVHGAAKGARPTHVPSTWEHAVNQIVPCLYPKNKCSSKKSTETSTDKNAFRLAICGAKGVGKSTFLRYATNRILSDLHIQQQQRKVAILDADVGQPEMSPPGLVTLTVLSEPLLTPPHYRALADHLPSKPQQQFAYFFGSVTSRNDPERYLALIQRLVQHYQEDVVAKSNNETVPLLINLDGWVKQLGFELLSTLLTDVLHPLTHVVQIVGTTKSKQFTLRGDVLNPETSPALLHVIHAYNSPVNATFDSNSNNNTLKTTSPAGAAPAAAVEPVNNLNGSSSTCNDEKQEEAAVGVWAKTPMSCVMPAQALRNLRLSTYFLNDVTIWYDLGFNCEGIRDDTCEIAHRLAGARPYAVPFEAVQIHWAGSDYFAELQRQSADGQEEGSGINDWVLDAINVKIVGLCCRSSGEPSSGDADGEPLRCVGFGLVRAIDRVRRVFYVLTPVDSHRLQGVNVLVGCGIEVPVEFWFRGVSAEASPYQSFTRNQTSSSVGSDPMTSRNSIGRKGHAAK